MDSHEAVYLIDSDSLSSQLIETTLCLCGHIVHTYASSASFMDCSSMTDVGCIIVNVTLSAHQCIEIQKELLWRGSDLTILMIASGSDTKAARCSPRFASLITLEDPYSKEQLCELVDAGIEMSGQKKTNRDRLEDVHRRLAQLTESERGVLKCLMKGMSHKNISSQLEISPRSVDRRRKSVLLKMDASSLQQLIAALAEIHFRT